MQEPPEYLLPFLHTVESTVLAVREEFRSMVDKDVEYAYEQLKDYYRKKGQGKDIREPESSSDRRQAIIDEILNSIEEREELNADDDYINSSDYQPNGEPIASLGFLYAMGFNRLIKSVRQWRKKDGKTGYLSFIERFVLR